MENRGNEERVPVPCRFGRAQVCHVTGILPQVDVIIGRGACLFVCERDDTFAQIVHGARRRIFGERDRDDVVGEGRGCPFG